MPGGRPAKLYKPEYCEMLIEHMSRGESFASFGAVVDVCIDTLYRWVKTHPEFADACARARLKCLREWEKIGMDGLWQQQGQGATNLNSAHWAFQMKNRFRDLYSDRTEVTGTQQVVHSGEVKQTHTLTVEEQKKQIAQLDAEFELLEGNQDE